jgi:hypothetical protein
VNLRFIKSLDALIHLKSAEQHKQRQKSEFSCYIFNLLWSSIQKPVGLIRKLEDNNQLPYSALLLAVFTYRIKRKDVGIIIKSAVAIKPKMFTSIMFLLQNCNDYVNC